MQRTKKRIHIKTKHKNKIDRQIDRQIDRYIDRYIDRQIDRQTDRQMLIVEQNLKMPTLRKTDLLSN